MCACLNLGDLNLKSVMEQTMVSKKHFFNGRKYLSGHKHTHLLSGLDIMRRILTPVVNNNPEVSISDIWSVRLGSKVSIQRFCDQHDRSALMISLIISSDR